MKALKAIMITVLYIPWLQSATTYPEKYLFIDNEQHSLSNEHLPENMELLITRIFNNDQNYHDAAACKISAPALLQLYWLSRYDNTKPPLVEKLTHFIQAQQNIIDKNSASSIKKQAEMRKTRATEARDILTTPLPILPKEKSAFLPELWQETLSQAQSTNDLVIKGLLRLKASNAALEILFAEKQQKEGKPNSLNDLYNGNADRYFMHSFPFDFATKTNFSVYDYTVNTLSLSQLSKKDQALFLRHDGIPRKKKSYKKRIGDCLCDTFWFSTGAALASAGIAYALWWLHHYRHSNPEKQDPIKTEFPS